MEKGDYATTKLIVTVTHDAKLAPDVLAERLFLFLSNDPDDRFAEIETVDDWDWQVVL